MFDPGSVTLDRSLPNSIEGTITGFEIGESGDLAMVTSVGGLPANAFGPLSISLAALDNE